MVVEYERLLLSVAAYDTEIERLEKVVAAGKALRRSEQRRKAQDAKVRNPSNSTAFEYAKLMRSSKTISEGEDLDSKAIAHLETNAPAPAALPVQMKHKGLH